MQPIEQIKNETEILYLDKMNPAEIQVGYGRLGTSGHLGYENKYVFIQGKRYTHALSSHPPARLVYNLGQNHHHFSCLVGINDDVRNRDTHADFSVVADGKTLAIAHVAAGETPRRLQADARGVQTLELVVTTTYWNFCHAVWLDPILDGGSVDSAALPITDCLNRAEITPPAVPISATRCLATIVSAGFEAWLDDLLGSFYAYANCPEAQIVVFTIDDHPACRQVIEKYGATAIPCRPNKSLNPTLKSVLYSVAHFVDAEQFLCLDADMLVIGDLQPIFGALDSCPPNTILACREGNGHGFQNLGHVLTTAYGGRSNDIHHILGHANGEYAYPLVVNDGLFAGSREALLALDGTIRSMPEATNWVDQYRHIRWRNQFIFNLALAKLNCGVELDPTFNLQLHVQNVDLAWSEGKIKATWNGRSVRVLHFSGGGRRKYPNWRRHYAGKNNPLARPVTGDQYHQFLSALRLWAARFGDKGLAWSFYGTTDGKSAQVKDADSLPLLGLLHYLVRSNGCIQVLESGTAKGISAACLASAVVHRQDGKVVTMDLSPHPEREDLWSMLPVDMRLAIEQRVGDSLSLMKTAVENGEQYQAILLDSLHTAGHVWAEFQLAAKLICPGGLILIHDINYKHGDVGRALEKIEAAGFNVIRLWSAVSGVKEDDNLGLAVIEGR